VCTLRSSDVGPLGFFLWGYLQVPYAYKHRMLLNSSETLLGIVRGKGSLKVDSIFGGHCMSPIYENLMETEADLVARTESVCVYIHKHISCI
jgi:hypothetical protein